MEWVNYQHLLYFWTVVRAGGISKASDELRLTPPTISAQLRTLEDSLGEKLLIRSGRNLKPTEMGHLVYQYADEIFSLGRELLGAVKQRPSGRPARLVVGIDDVLPKEIAYRLIKPALSLRTPVRILCREASLERLVADLADMASRSTNWTSSSPTLPPLPVSTSAPTTTCWATAGSPSWEPQKS